jgi:hypothetical protein
VTLNPRRLRRGRFHELGTRHPSTVHHHSQPEELIQHSTDDDGGDERSGSELQTLAQHR